MKNLSAEQLEKLASGPKVRRIAVENFLTSLDTSSNIAEALHNLFNDSCLYKWNHETRLAIRTGIKIIYSNN